MNNFPIPFLKNEKKIILLIDKNVTSYVSNDNSGFRRERQFFLVWVSKSFTSTPSLFYFEIKINDLNMHYFSSNF